MALDAVAALETQRASDRAERGIATRARLFLEMLESGSGEALTAALGELIDHVRVADVLRAAAEKQVNEARGAAQSEAAK